MGRQLTEFVNCAEWERLYDLFVSTLGDVIALEQAAETPVGKHGHTDLLDEAVRRSKRAKEALLHHLRAHSDCGLAQS